VTEPEPKPDTNDEEERDVRHAGGGRTSGETSVDDDLGRGGLAGQRTTGHGSTVTLIASPRATIPNASSVRSRGRCSVIRSFTGT
jgi:hypothetical protein